jgi:hypothetical protein
MKLHIFLSVTLSEQLQKIYQANRLDTEKIVRSIEIKEVIEKRAGHGTLA